MLSVESRTDYLEKEKLSFFEMTVGLSFWYFKKQQVEFAIVEVGLGGRLDATNIIDPILSLITNVGLDHQEFLGTEIRKIAFEKAGIIKNNTPVVISEYQQDIHDIFLNKAKKFEKFKALQASHCAFETPSSAPL